MSFRRTDSRRDSVEEVIEEDSFECRGLKLCSSYLLCGNKQN